VHAHRQAAAPASARTANPRCGRRSASGACSGRAVLHLPRGGTIRRPACWRVLPLVSGASVTVTGQQNQPWVSPSCVLVGSQCLPTWTFASAWGGPWRVAARRAVPPRGPSSSPEALSSLGTTVTNDRRRATAMRKPPIELRIASLSTGAERSSKLERSLHSRVELSEAFAGLDGPRNPYCTVVRRSFR
jgi:hypothetical protein